MEENNDRWRGQRAGDGINPSDDQTTSIMKQISGDMKQGYVSGPSSLAPVVGGLLEGLASGLLWIYSVTFRFCNFLITKHPVILFLYLLIFWVVFVSKTFSYDNLRELQYQYPPKINFKKPEEYGVDKAQLAFFRKMTSNELLNYYVKHHSWKNVKERNQWLALCAVVTERLNNDKELLKTLKSNLTIQDLNLNEDENSILINGYDSDIPKYFACTLNHSYYMNGLDLIDKKYLADFSLEAGYAAYNRTCDYAFKVGRKVYPYYELIDFVKIGGNVHSDISNQIEKSLGIKYKLIRSVRKNSGDINSLLIAIMLIWFAIRRLRKVDEREIDNRLKLIDQRNSPPSVLDKWNYFVYKEDILTEDKRFVVVAVLSCAVFGNASQIFNNDWQGTGDLSLVFLNSVLFLMLIMIMRSEIKSSFVKIRERFHVE